MFGKLTATIFNDIPRDCDDIRCNCPGSDKKPENTRLSAFFRIIFLENKLKMAGRSAMANQFVKTDKQTTREFNRWVILIFLTMHT